MNSYKLEWCEPSFLDGAQKEDRTTNLADGIQTESEMPANDRHGGPRSDESRTETRSQGYFV